MEEWGRAVRVAVRHARLSGEQQHVYAYRVGRDWHYGVKPRKIADVSAGHEKRARA
jgi:hypothetical protein